MRDVSDLCVAVTLLKSNGTHFRVSTINRRCSAIGASDMIYSETLVFDDSEKIIAQGDGVKDSITTHIMWVNLVHAHGADAQAEFDRNEDRL